MLKRGRMKPWNNFRHGNLFIATIRQADSDPTGELIYEFKVYDGYNESEMKAGPLLTTLSLDYHSDIDNGTFFLQEDAGDKHVTIDQFKEDPGYDKIEERVLEYIDNHYSKE